VQPTFPLQTAFGPIELPASRVAAMVSIGEVRPTQLLVTTDGEAFSGTLRLDAIKLELSSGQMTAIPLNGVARFGYRQRAGETAGFPTASTVRLQLAPPPDEDAAAVPHPLLALSNGDRLVGSLSGRLVLDAAFDTIDVDAPEVRGLHPTGAGAEVQVTLWD